jgi:hypothetical protein
MRVLGEVNEPRPSGAIKVALHVVFQFFFNESLFNIPTERIHVLPKAFNMGLECPINIDGATEVTCSISYCILVGEPMSYQSPRRTQKVGMAQSSYEQGRINIWKFRYFLAISKGLEALSLGKWGRW